MAKKRFYYLESKLQRNPDLKKQYCSFIDEYVSMGHMSKVPSTMVPVSDISEEASNQSFITQYILPHHAILKPTSSTTKLRVVFDASAKTTTGTSLNDILMVGPSIQDELFSIILRFRKYIYAFTADVEKMYRMVEVHKDDRKYQQIFWRSDPLEDLQLYELNTVTYGTSSAPYLATRVLQQISIDEAEVYPIASSHISDFYMDDIMSGSGDIQSAIELQTQMINMLKSGGMKLRKFSSNSKEMLNKIPQADREQILSADETQTINAIKALGLIWVPDQDKFRFNLPLSTSSIEPFTKREVLSQVSKTFDPLGLLSPLVIRAKIFLQDLWLLKLEWDDPLPHEYQQFWLEYLNQFDELQTLHINRCVMIHNPTRIELHGFGDASKKAYGAVLYIRCIDQFNNVTVEVLCSKSRVAPLKKTTIPRLELCAALLLSRLTLKVVQSMKINFDDITLWSDFTIVLSWLKSPANQMKTFVGNRVSEIQDTPLPIRWSHIDTGINPADLVSRGLTTTEFINSSLWWSGPPFLSQSDVPLNFSHADVSSHQSQEFLEEFEPSNPLAYVSAGATNRIEYNILQQYSSFNRTVDIVSYALRYINNLRRIPQIRILTLELQVAEREAGLNLLIHWLQRSEFATELRDLKAGNQVKFNSSLRKLSPFIDQHGLIRVGGRIRNSNLAYDAKHQIVLPKGHHLTKIIFRQYHEDNLHCGSQSLLNHVRQRFWPIQGGRLAKSTVQKCMICFRNKPKSIQQVMGDLPTDRVTPGGVFRVVGVDYCGPFTTTTCGRRKPSAEKTYIAIFVCFRTKAIHLEVVSELSTKNFMAALKRFVSRRGTPVAIHSDNGSNFIGANNELKRIQQFLESVTPDIQKFCLTQNIEWHFIPPRAPNFGGLWEAGVKSTKTHLKRIMMNRVLTFEEFNTLVIQIEACLNSRPLTPASDDPNDLMALTPGHFLIGRPLTALPDRDESAPIVNQLKHWRQIQHMHQSFWNRWSSEVLHTMQQRDKWWKSNPNIQLNDLMLIITDGLPPTKWLLGRVIELHHGKDGKVRVATLKTQDGTIKRAISKLCPLPKPDDDQSVPPTLIG